MQYTAAYVIVWYIGHHVASRHVPRALRPLPARFPCPLYILLAIRLASSGPAGPPTGAQERAGAGGAMRGGQNELRLHRNTPPRTPSSKSYPPPSKTEHGVRGVELEPPGASITAGQDGMEVLQPGSQRM
jgi:hypothetical protein